MRPHAVTSWVLLTATLLLGCSDSTGVGYENAIVASMKSDLLELVAAQDAFYLTNGDYAGLLGTSEAPGTGGAGVASFTPSHGNVVVLTYRDASSWTAIIVNPAIRLSPNTCGIYHGPGDASPNPAVTAPRTVGCWNDQ